MKKLLYYPVMFFIMLLVMLVIIEAAFRLFVFTKDSDYEQIYSAITSPDMVVPYSSQTFLNYINTPNQKDEAGNKEVNSMGLRYPREVSLQKPDSTLRILFMGGSTTFGDIEDTFEVFASLIERELRNNFLPRQSRYNDVECLNGGVHGLTSPELLIHFQLKYQYLNPDLLVLHTGFNDAFSYAGIHGSVYQPDYHNCRRVFQDVPVLTPIEMNLLKSKAFAYALIHLRLKDFLKNNLEDNIFFYHSNDKLWFKPGNAAINDSLYNAFYNNIKTLLNVAGNRGIQVLLVPEVCDSTKMPANLRGVLPAGLQLNKHFLMELSEREHVAYLELPDSQFTSDVFLNDDGIHVNNIGERRKAMYIGGAIGQLLQRR